MIEQRLLESRLDEYLLRRQDLFAVPAPDLQAPTVAELQELDGKIEAAAWNVRPRSPEAAIRQAKWRLNMEKLGQLMATRCSWVPEPGSASEAVQISVRRIEHRILDLARRLEPNRPQVAISQATGFGQRHLVLSEWWSEERAQRLSRISGRLQRILRVPEPSQLQRVASELKDLARFDELTHEARTLAANRRALPFRGNPFEIEHALAQLQDPRELLENHLPLIYTDASSARRSLRASYRTEGVYETLQKLAEDPSRFGKLQRFSGIRPSRKAALESVEKASKKALEMERTRMEHEDTLKSAKRYQSLQDENYVVLRALGDRETLLSELGRQMEGLELKEVRPVMRSGQAQMFEEIRHAEATYLEPLRRASQKLPDLLQGESTLTAHQAKKLAALFETAPRHITKRLGPPQIQVAMVAASMVRAATRTAAKSMAV